MELKIAAIDAPNATQIMTLNIIPINIQTRYALKKLDLLFLPSPNANTNIIMMFLMLNIFNIAKEIMANAIEKKKRKQ